ncbi:RICIN domain-containing protein [Streptomyces sp. NPDC029216]|uniref:RICIN domain-containing protein n=1 Tax=Streptomyces sp. NPDC029216 TaxID=3154701 RepID=UPI0033EF34D7
MKLARTFAAALMAVIVALFVTPSVAGATTLPTTDKYFTGEGDGPYNLVQQMATDNAYAQATAQGYPSALCHITQGPTPPILIWGETYQSFVKIHCFPPPPEGSGPIIAVPNGKCVDVKDGSTQDGAIVQLYGCHGGNNQMWVLEPDKTIRSMGHCLDVQYAKTENGSRLGLNSCHGAANQQFELLPGGKLRSVHSGKCVDVAVTWFSTRLVIWDCSDARPYQNWRGSALGL